MEFLKDLPPSAIIAIVIFWALREFFGFIKALWDKKQEASTSATTVVQMSPAMEAELRAMARVLDKISDHIEVNTDLVKALTFEVKETRADVDRIREEFDEFRRHPRTS